MADLASEVRQASSAISYNDLKTQETKGIGATEAENESKRNKSEKSIDDLSGILRVTEPAIQIDANVRATQSNSVYGLPE